MTVIEERRRLVLVNGGSKKFDQFISFSFSKTTPA